MNTEKESRVRVPGFYFLKGGKMKAGDHVKTPRFLTVKIEKVFETEEEARKEGFTEPTHYNRKDGYDIVGKSLDVYHMLFAAYKVR